MKHLMIILFGLLVLASCRQTDKPNPELWAWSHARKNYTQAQWDSLFNKMADHNFKGILMGADSAVLVKVIPIARKFDIDVHAWMWTMNRKEAPDEWLSVNALGKSLAEQKAYVGYYRFMCPALPEVRDYIKNKVETLARIEGLAGVHLDYIRYVDVFLPVGLLPKYNLVQDSIMPEFDYGYHPYLRNKFKKQFGVDPFELENMTHDSTWLQFRLDQVTDAVNLLPPVTKKYGIELTAAVFPEPEMSSRMVRQQWNKWNVDRFFPMIYYSFYNENPEWIGEVVQKGVAEVPNKPVVCGLYVPGIPDVESFRRSIHEALGHGAVGISLFEIGAMKDFHWQVLKEVF